MSYKTILLHVEPAQAADARLRLAVGLARSFDAALIGLGARCFDTWPDPTGISQRALHEAIAEDSLKAEDAFRREAAPLGENATWRWATEFPVEAMVKQSFAADLIVAGRPPDEAPAQTVADTGGMILRTGVPVLVAPPDVDRVQARRIVIGWKNTREARRAIWDALPFLKRAEQVHLVRILDEQDESGTEAELAQLVERLRRHDVTAVSQTRPRTADSVADDLLNLADALSAEMIVTGAYSRPRLQQWILGGVTRGLLSRSRKLVLFSH